MLVHCQSVAFSLGGIAGFCKGMKPLCIPRTHYKIKHAEQSYVASVKNPLDVLSSEWQLLQSLVDFCCWLTIAVSFGDLLIASNMHQYNAPLL